MGPTVIAEQQGETNDNNNNKMKDKHSVASRSKF